MAMADAVEHVREESAPSARRAVRLIGLGLTQVLIIVTCVFSLFVTLADWVGWFDAEPWFVERIPTMTLVLLSVVALYLLQERREEHAELRRAVAERDLELSRALKADVRSANVEQLSGFGKLLDAKGVELVDAVNGVSIEKLRDQESYHRRLAKEISAAEKSVHDLTWGAVSAAARSTDEEGAFQAYLDAIPEACKRRTALKYREVYTFPSLARVSRAESLLAQANEKSLHNYWVRYYDISNHDALPPLMQFTIIDARVVILGTHRGARGSADAEEYLLIQHPLIVKKFLEYFAVIWQGAKPIRDPSLTDLSVFPRVKNQLQGKRGRQR